MLNRLFLSAGIDDIDNILGGCTTHFATILIKKIYKYGGFLLDYPRLIRLNPNIPWKTRGNGAVAIEFSIKKSLYNDFLNDVKRSIIEYIGLEGSSPASTQPALVVVDNIKLNKSDDLSTFLYHFSQYATYSIVSRKSLDEALVKLSDIIIDTYTPLGKRGLVGSLAAIGNVLPYDYTYELILYRNLSKRGERFDKDTEGKIINFFKKIEKIDSFAHIDYESNKLLISPKGPDPVIFGIRGENPSTLYNMFKKILKAIKLDFESWLIYVTNQGTGEHLYNASMDTKLTGYRQYYRHLKVFNHPSYLEGAHLYLPTKNGESDIKGLIYYESGRMKEYGSMLNNGDEVILGGALKFSEDPSYRLALNTELIELINKSVLYDIKPICPRCSVKMVSMGSDKGYVCKKCKYRVSETSLNFINQSDNVFPSILLPPLRSIRHLSKPLKRYCREKYHRVKGIRSIKFMWLNDL